MSSTVTEDRLLGGRVRLRQPARGYRAGIEPPLLAATVEASPGARIADLGCGAGAVSLCLLARRPDLYVTAVEADPEAAALARANAELNGCAERLAIVEADVCALPADLGSFDAVMSNPPFHAAAESDASPHPAKARATIDRDLAGWIAAAARLLRHRGHLYLIYRADRLDQLLTALAPRFGAVALLPLWPRAGQPAKRLILRAQLGSRAPLVLHPGLALHQSGNSYTQAATEVLRDAAPLAF